MALMKSLCVPALVNSGMGNSQMRTVTRSPDRSSVRPRPSTLAHADAAHSSHSEWDVMRSEVP